MTSQSASAFIEQIKTEYRAVVEAEKSALPQAERKDVGKGRAPDRRSALLLCALG